MEIDATTILSYPVNVPINDKNPCALTLDPIEILIPVIVVWVLPKGYQFSRSGVSGLGDPDFQDGRFDGMGRRRYRWTARRPGTCVWRTYSLSIEWVDSQGSLQSCVAPDLRIINRS